METTHLVESLLLEGLCFREILKYLFEKDDAPGVLILISMLKGGKDKLGLVRGLKYPKKTVTERIKIDCCKMEIPRLEALSVRKSWKDAGSLPFMKTSVTWDPLVLWFRPLICCLLAIASNIRQLYLTSLTSIGCGSGLLEWLLWKTTGLTVVGYEVNRMWWVSEYAPPVFIPLLYADEMEKVPTIPKSHAVLFSYFNNGEMFRMYLAKYEGPLVIIIGPTCAFRHSNPHPMELIGSATWKLTMIHIQPDGDVIAFYGRS